MSCRGLKVNIQWTALKKDKDILTKDINLLFLFKMLEFTYLLDIFVKVTDNQLGIRHVGHAKVIVHGHCCLLDDVLMYIQGSINMVSTNCHIYKKYVNSKVHVQ